jgi:hypothetical protein
VDATALKNFDDAMERRQIVGRVDHGAEPLLTRSERGGLFLVVDQSDQRLDVLDRRGVNGPLPVDVGLVLRRPSSFVDLPLIVDD